MKPLRAWHAFPCVLAIVLAVCVAGASEAAVVYVRASATGANDGTTWTNAYVRLQDALVGVTPGTEVWVADGTYRPDETNANPTGSGSRSASFQLVNGVAIFGGFRGQAGDEGVNNNTTRPLDGVTGRPTLASSLSGDLDGNDGGDPPNYANYGDNCFHVVTGDGRDSTAVLDGFTIRNGYAEGSQPFPDNHAGGMLIQSGSPTIRNCEFRYHRSLSGGAMLISGSIASTHPTIDRCLFLDNNAGNNGGAINVSHAAPTITNTEFRTNSAQTLQGGAVSIAGASSVTLADCVFTDNSTVADIGGAVASYEGASTMARCRFYSNHAASYGGAMAIVAHSSTIEGCTFVGNSSLGSGGAVYNGGASPLIVNSKFVGNSSSGNGGAISAQSFSAPQLRSSSFWANHGTNGGMMFIDLSSSTSITNCILWGNTDSGSPAGNVQIFNYSGAAAATVTYSDVQDGWAYAGSNNSAADPRFVDANGSDNVAGTLDDDLRLRLTSPCIDAGDNLNVPFGITTDLDGNNRFIDIPCRIDTGVPGNGHTQVIDMGAHEYTDVDTDGDGVIDACEDCGVGANGNQADCDGNGVLDECEIAICPPGDLSCADCNHNGVPDGCEIANCPPGNLSCADCNHNGLPDGCEGDCNGNGVPDDCDLASGARPDCNQNGVPDDCDITNCPPGNPSCADCNHNGVPDGCEGDCNGNGVPDDCDLVSGAAADCNHNGQPDSCEPPGPPTGGLIGYWQADNSGLDSSGYGRHLGLNGGLGYSGGLFGSAFDYGCCVPPGQPHSPYAVRTADDDAFDFGTSNFTIMLWVYWYTLDDEQVLIEKMSNGGGWTLTKLSGTSGLRFDTTCGGIRLNGPAPFAPALNTWHQIVITRASYLSFSILAIFFDGNPSPLAATLLSSSAPICNTGAPLLIGRRFNQPAWTMSGRIDEVAIWDRAIDLAALYNGGVPRPLVDCNGNYLADVNDPDCNGNGVPDDCDICHGASADCNHNGVPDECEADCNGNGIPDTCEHAASGPVVFVNAAAAPGGDGQSWATAFYRLSDALNSLDCATYAGVTEIWVSAGTYKPAAPNGSRSATFQLVNGISIYGGFAGTETLLSQRQVDPQTGRPVLASILSGDLNGDDGPNFANDGENVYHVVTASNTDSTAVLDGVTIRGGRTRQPYSGDDSAGGGLMCLNGDLTIRNCTITANRAIEGIGAGAYLSGGTPTFQNCLLVGNNSGATGAGLQADSVNLSLINCRFESNSAGSVAGALIVHSGTQLITNCQFVGNTSGLYAGAVLLASGAVATISGSTFSNNSAAGNAEGGGAIYADSASFSLSGCQFTSNNTNASGGAIRSSGSGSRLIVNSKFVGNTSGTLGGAISVQSANTLALRNCSFWANHAGTNGGGMFVDLSSSASVANCIVWGNTDSGSPAGNVQIFNYSGSAAVTVTYSDVQDGWAYAGSNNSAADPLFVDPDGPNNTAGDADDDLRLQFASPCIDAGNNTAVPAGTLTDLDGNNRFIDVPCRTDTGVPGNGHTQIVDMGAYETPANVQPVPARGDANCDGLVNNFDIDPFVIGLLSNSAQPPASYDAGVECWYSRTCWGDINADLSLNNFDIDPFVNCVLLGGCP